jgi:hypothetical protein
VKDRYARKAKRQLHPLAALPTKPPQDTLMAVSAFFESFNDTLGSHKDTYFGEVTGIERRGRTIAATMNAGRGGLESTLSDPDRRHEPTFYRERRHIERVPIRQLVVVPENSLTGYWIIEAVGLRTLSEAYRREFRRAFTGRWSRLSPTFEHIVHHEAWTAYEDSADAYVEQVRVVRTRIARDRAESMGIGDTAGEYIQIVQTAEGQQRGRLLRQVREALYTRDDKGRLTPKEDDLTEVSATIRIGDREASVTIDRERPMGMRVHLDAEKDQRPSDTYVYSRARDWVVELAERDDVTLPAGWATGDWEHDSKFGRLGAGNGFDQGTDQQDQGD